MSPNPHIPSQVKIYETGRNAWKGPQPQDVSEYVGLSFRNKEGLFAWEAIAATDHGLLPNIPSYMACVSIGDSYYVEPEDSGRYIRDGLYTWSETDAVLCRSRPVEDDPVCSPGKYLGLSLIVKPDGREALLEGLAKVASYKAKGDVLSSGIFAVAHKIARRNFARQQLAMVQ